jgi:hypothetical protein
MLNYVFDPHFPKSVITNLTRIGAISIEAVVHDRFSMDYRPISFPLPQSIS